MMTEEEYLRNRMDMINRNSTYGITEEARKLAEINYLKDEVAKLRRENEDLKKILWAVADKVKDFEKEDK
jgi:cell shape-determining protein MreC